MQTKSERGVTLMAIVTGRLILLCAALLTLTVCDTVSPTPPAETNRSTAFQEGVSFANRDHSKKVDAFHHV